MSLTKPKYLFTSGDKKGATGPNQTEANDFYKNSNIRVSIVGEGIQKWRVPYSGVYYIEAAGAAGLSSCDTSKGGKGAQYLSFFTLYRRDILYILVGQQGTIPHNGWGGSGGGGTYVAKKVKTSQYLFNPDNAYVNPLVIAAGGGGSGDCNDPRTPKEGEQGHCETADEGGGATGQIYSSGGSGFKSNSKNDKSKSFLNGGISGATYTTKITGIGGFGGGGNSLDAGGGGGGYKGGDSGPESVRGFGGYSFSSGEFVNCTSGFNEGNGFVRISLIQRINCYSLYRKNQPFSFSFIFLSLLVSH